MVWVLHVVPLVQAQQRIKDGDDVVKWMSQQTFQSLRCTIMLLA